MALNNDENVDNLTKELLLKCEVSSLNQFYHKWLEENDHIAAVKKICTIHKNFNEDKVITDIASINDLLIINIIDYTQYKNLQNLKREKYLVDFTGIGKLLRYMKRRGYLKTVSKLNEVLEKLGIETNEENKVISLINLAIKKRIIYALIEKAETEEKEFILIFTSRLADPQHRKEFIKLLLIIIAGLIIISILLPIVLFFNA